jgi:hypothetical protein
MHTNFEKDPFYWEMIATLAIQVAVQLSGCTGSNASNEGQMGRINEEKGQDVELPVGV